jgi:hypothetical protein
MILRFYFSSRLGLSEKSHLLGGTSKRLDIYSFVLFSNLSNSMTEVILFGCVCLHKIFVLLNKSRGF